MLRRTAMPVALLAALLAGCGDRAAPPVESAAERADAAPTPLGMDRAALWQWITVGDPDGTQPTGVLPADPFYASWPLFPGPPDDPDEFRDERLGLATHGRWVTVHVGAEASGFLDAYLPAVAADAGGVPAADFPDGSVIVKVNFPNVDEPDVIAQAAAPAVLTVLYKPGGDACDSGFRYDGTHCLGGEWTWAFYGLDSGPLERDVFDRFVGESTEAFCINCHDPAFRTDYVRSLERRARAIAHAAEPVRNPQRPPTVHDDDPFCEHPTLSPTLPADVALDPASIDDPARRQRLFDCFAWRAFVALDWRAGERRGDPDPTAPFGSLAGGETVWETYKATYELFQPGDVDWNPAAPGEAAGRWDSPRPLPPTCEGPQGRPVVSMISKSHSRFPDVGREGVGQQGAGRAAPGDQPDVGNETGQAFAGSFGTLTDRNGELVRYQVLFGETEFDFLVPTAPTRGLTPAGPNGGDRVTLPDGSVEVKAAWKLLCTGDGCRHPDDPARFYHREILLFDAGDGSCEPATVGLVGLHVVAKTFWAPQWIWATFEHVDNAPLAGEEGEGYSFWDPGCRPPSEPFFAACSAQPFLAPKGKGDPCCPNVPINRWPGVGFGAEFNNQITRLDPVGGSGLAEAFHELFAGTPEGGFFANYVLVGTQWPMNGRRPAPPGEPLSVNSEPCEGNAISPDGSCYTLVPGSLRNTAIESYMTTYEMQGGKAVQVSNRSCMGCHASGTDFSYVWADAVEQVVPLAGGGGSPALPSP